MHVPDTFQITLPMRHRKITALFSVALTVFLFSIYAYFIRRGHMQSLYRDGIQLSRTLQRATDQTTKGMFPERQMTVSRKKYPDIAYALVWNEENAVVWQRQWDQSGHTTRFLREREKGVSFNPLKSLFSDRYSSSVKQDMYIFRGTLLYHNRESYGFEFGFRFHPWLRNIYAMALGFFASAMVGILLCSPLLVRSDKKRRSGEQRPRLHAGRDGSAATKPTTKTFATTATHIPTVDDYTDTSLVLQSAEVYLDPGTAEAAPVHDMLRKMENTDEDLLPEVEITDQFALRLGKGKEHIIHNKVVLPDIEWEEEKLPSSGEAHLVEPIRAFEEKIHRYSSLRDVSIAIITELCDLFPDMDITIYLRQSEEEMIQPAVIACRGEIVNMIDHPENDGRYSIYSEAKLYDALQSERNGFVWQSTDEFWIPMVTNNVFIGALCFYSDEPSPYPEEFRRMIKELLKPIALAYFHYRLYEMVITDPLTGLLGKRQCIHSLRSEFRRHSSADESSAALMVLDIDFFKSINDSFGHRAGDQALKFFADQIHRLCGPLIQAFRYGGEEFVVLFTDNDSDTAAEWYHTLQRNLANEPVFTEPDSIHITASAGIAAYSPEISDEQQWFELADQCLYNAKKSGRNRAVVYGSIDPDIPDLGEAIPSI